LSGDNSNSPDSNDEVVQETQTHEWCGLLDAPGRRQVLGARGGIARGVVVGESEGDPVTAEHGLEYVTNWEQGAIRGATGQGDHPICAASWVQHNNQYPFA